MSYDLKSATPDTSLPTNGFLFGADSQSATNPSVYSTQTVATTLLGSTALTGATVTTSQPVLDLSQTWNAGAVTFTGLKFNATDTASAAGSMLADFQVGGASKFQIFKTGGATAAAALSVLNTGGSSVLQMAQSASYGYHMASGYAVTWGSAATLDGSVDLTLRRAAAATLQLGAADAAAPVAQTLQVQSVVAGTTNTAGANFTINGSRGSGSGAGGSIIFQVAPAGSSGTAQNSYFTLFTIAASKAVTSYGSFTVTNTGGSGVLQMASSASYGYHMAKGYVVSWGSGASLDGTVDLTLARDAANVMRLENCLLLKGVTVASLPDSPVAGTLAKVTDSTVTTGQISGTGSNTVLAYYKSSGTAGWYVLAAL